MTNRPSFFDEAWLLVLTVGTLFSLEVLWSLRAKPLLPYSATFAPLALAALLLLALAVLLALRWTERRGPNALPPLGLGLVLLVLGTKLYAVDGLTHPLTFLYLAIPPVLVAHAQWRGRKRGRTALFWAVVVAVFLTISTDTLKVLMLGTRGTDPNHVMIGVTLLGLGFVGLELLTRFLHPMARSFGTHPWSSGTAAAVLLLVAVGSWAATGVYSRHPTGLEDFSSDFTGTVPRTQLPEGRTLQDLPNIILISIDTLRWDKAPPVDTGLEVPALRGLRRDSLAFTHHFSSTVWTLPSHASLFTGRLPWRHGAVSINASIDNSVSLYSQRLHKLGYATAGFTDGAFLAKAHGFARGYGTYRVPPFDTSSRYDRFLPGGLQYLAAAGIPTSSGVSIQFHYTGPDPGPQKQHTFRPNLSLAREWLQRHEKSSDRPFFLFLHTYQVHDYNHIYPESLDRLHEEHPDLANIFQDGRNLHHPRMRKNWKKVHRKLSQNPLRNMRALLERNPDELETILGAKNPEDPDLRRFLHWRRYARDILEGLWHLYRYGIEATDDSLGDFLSFLKGRDLYRPTMIVFVSDHGEGFLRTSRVLGHHGGQPEDTLTRVPLWIKFPANRHAGDTIQQFTQISDVFPMIFQYLDLRGDPPPTIGRRPSLRGMLEGTDPGRRFIRGSDQTRPYRPPRFFVRGPRFKMSKSLTGDLLRYRGVQDEALSERMLSPDDVPGKTRRELVDRVDALIEDYRRSDRPYKSSNRDALTPRQRRQLEALGYLD